MSGKNKLQEYCQKNKIDLPVYQSEMTTDMEWRSKVTVIVDHTEFSYQTKKTFQQKKLAEHKAANILLKKLLNHEEHKEEKISVKTYNQDCVFPDIYLIDLENKPFFKSKLNDKNLYIGFLNSIHQSVHKYDHWHQCNSDKINQEISHGNKLLYLIDGGTIDLVDHFITAFIYPLIDFVGLEKTTVHIISGDHAAWCTRICLEKVIQWKGLMNITVVNATAIN